MLQRMMHGKRNVRANKPTLRQMRTHSGPSENGTAMLLLLSRHGSIAAGNKMRARASGISFIALAPPPTDIVDVSLTLADAHAVFPTSKDGADGRGMSSAADLRALLARYGCGGGCRNINNKTTIGWHLDGKGTLQSPLRGFFLVRVDESHLARLDKCIYEHCRLLACFALYPRALHQTATLSNSSDSDLNDSSMTRHPCQFSTTIVLNGFPRSTNPILLKRAARPGGGLTCCRVCIGNNSGRTATQGSVLDLVSTRVKPTAFLEFVQKSWENETKADSTDHLNIRLPHNLRHRVTGSSMTSITNAANASPGGVATSARPFYSSQLATSSFSSSKFAQNRSARNSGWMGKGNRGGNPRGRDRNTSRSRVFRQWLERTIGIERLREGAGVMDVAGGKGELSFELKTYGCIESTIVDPRPMDIVRMMKGLTAMSIQRMRRNAYHSWVPNRDMPLALAVNLPLPGHIRAWFPPKNSKQSNEKIALYYNEEVATSDLEVEKLEKLCRDCSCCIGMHSDQATEAIVDFGIASGKPYAVVPCCVFPEMFQERVLPSGHRVRTYDQFIEYLLAKGAKMQVLDFPGRNIVIYGGV